MRSITKFVAALAVVGSIAAVAANTSQPAEAAKSVTPAAAGTAAGANEVTIRDKIQREFPKAVVQSVKPGPFVGLFEVVIDDQVFYTNTTADYIFIGNLIDVKTKHDYAGAKASQLAKARFSNLPFDSAIKVVKGNGERKMAVFTDPDCLYCKKLEQELKSVSNVTVYSFLYPIDSLNPGATKKAEAIWCAPNREKAWSDWMDKGVLPKGNTKCTTPIAEIAKLGAKFNVQGTPTIVFENGEVVPGMVPSDKLEEMLNEAEGQ